MRLRKGRHDLHDPGLQRLMRPVDCSPHSPISTLPAQATGLLWQWLPQFAVIVFYFLVQYTVFM